MVSSYFYYLYLFAAPRRIKNCIFRTLRITPGRFIIIYGVSLCIILQIISLPPHINCKMNGCQAMSQGSLHEQVLRNLKAMFHQL